MVWVAIKMIQSFFLFIFSVWSFSECLPVNTFCVWIFIKEKKKGILIVYLIFTSCPLQTDLVFDFLILKTTEMVKEGELIIMIILFCVRELEVYVRKIEVEIN